MELQTRPCNSAPKGDCSEADTVFCVEGSMERVFIAWRGPLGGVAERGMVILRSFRNLGGLWSSFAKVAARASL